VKKTRRKIRALLSKLLQAIYWRRKHRSIYKTFQEKFDKKEFSKDHLIIFNKYGGYCIPVEAAHRPAVSAVAMGGVHEKDTINFIFNNINDGDIIHAGAFFGDFLPALSQACGTTGEVWAFEPNKSNHQCAACTMEINKLGNVHLFNAGVSSIHQTKLMRTSDSNGITLGGGSYLIGEASQHNASEIEEVDLVTIDGTVQSGRRISIIQLDVEGHEIDALKGAMNIIRQWKPVLILETRTEYSLMDDEWFINNILGMNYKLKTYVHRNAVFTTTAP
jgi:FkbM family methyltransferase